MYICIYEYIYTHPLLSNRSPPRNFQCLQMTRAQACSQQVGTNQWQLGLAHLQQRTAVVGQLAPTFLDSWGKNPEKYGRLR